MDILRRLAKGVIPILFFFQVASLWAQAPSEFHWIDLEKEEWTVNTIRKALHDEHFTAIRDIGVLGDAALVFTATRSKPDAMPDSDLISVYAVSLRALSATKLLSGYQMHNAGWSTQVKDHRGEMATTYLDCVDCEATTFFTAFYFDGKADTWQARWMTNQHGAPVSSMHTNKDYAIQQVYAVLGDREGTDALITWSHYEYYNSKRVEDFLYKYDVDPVSNLDRIMRLSGKDATDMQVRLCQADQAWASVHHGQDLPVCQALVRSKSTPARHITTTPPVKNEGRSRPPGSHS